MRLKGVDEDVDGGAVGDADEDTCEVAGEAASEAPEDFCWFYTDSQH